MTLAADTAGEKFILWSGGAADCLIVAAHGPEGCFLVHQTRSGPRPQDIVGAIRDLGHSPTVWLASGMFATMQTQDGELRSELIHETVGALTDPASGLAIEATYSQGALALNLHTGETAIGRAVTTKLQDPRRAK